MDEKTLNYLAVLDLSPGVSIEEVKRAYRELALIWHPDKVPDQVKDRATRKFQHLTEAYQWIARNPSVLKQTRSTGQRTTRHTHTASSNESTASAGSSDMMAALRGFATDRDDGIYIYPDLDRGKLIEFSHQVTLRKTFPNFRLDNKDIMVFYDIDGSGEEGMAITRGKHLVNNNVDALFDITEINEVRMEDAMFFWSQVSVRLKGQATFHLAGYTSTHAGRVFTDIIKRLIRT